MIRRAAILLLALAPLCAALVFGAQGIGRLLLAAGLPGPAAALLQDPRWKGAALAAAGRWDEAAAAFSSPQDAYDRGVALTRAGRYAEALAAFDAALARDGADADAAANREIVEALLAAGAAGRAREGGAAGADATKEIKGPRSTPELSEAMSSGSGLVGSIRSKSVGGEGRGGAPRAGRADEDAQTGQKNASGAAGNAGGAGQAGGEMADITKMMAARDLRARRTLDHHGLMATRDWLAALPDDPGRWLKLHVRAEQARRRASAREAREDD